MCGRDLVGKKDAPHEFVGDRIVTEGPLKGAILFSNCCMSHSSFHSYVSYLVQQVRRERPFGQRLQVECLKTHVCVERAHLSECLIDRQPMKLRAISAFDAVEEAVGQQVRNALQ